jgi:hypothetical protein
LYFQFKIFFKPNQNPQRKKSLKTKTKNKLDYLPPKNMPKFRTLLARLALPVQLFLLCVILATSFGGVLSRTVQAADSAGLTTTPEKYISLTDCAVSLPSSVLQFAANLTAASAAIFEFANQSIPDDKEIGPCQTDLNGTKVLSYNCKKGKTEGLGDRIAEEFFRNIVFVRCERALGSDNYSETSNCVQFSSRGVLGGSRNLSLDKKTADPVKNPKSYEFCQKQYAEFCTYMASSNSPNSGNSKDFCDELKFDPTKTSAAIVTNTGIETTGCTTPTKDEIDELKKTKAGLDESKLCKTTNGNIYQCANIDPSTKAGKDCVAANDTAKATATTVSDVGSGSGTGEGGVLGNIFSILYKIVAIIIIIFLVIAGLLQAVVIFMLVYITGTLMNLSPTAPFLTNIGIPISNIFNNIANLMMGFLFILLGAQAMLGLQKTDKIVGSLVKLATFAFVSNFVYLVLAFVVSLFDGFAQLIIRIFAGGDIYKLFFGLTSQFTSISKLREPGNLLPSLSQVGKNVGSLDLTSTDVSGVTEILLKEALVVGLLFILILVFKRVFILILSRSTILFLFLVVSPLLALAYLAQDLLPKSFRKIMDGLPDQLLYSIIFNVVFIATIVLVFTIANQAQVTFDEALKTTGITANTYIPGISSVTAQANTSALESGATALINAAIALVPFAIALKLLDYVAEFFEKTVPDAVSGATKSIGEGISGGMKGYMRGDNLFKIAANAGSNLATGGGGQLRELIQDSVGSGSKLIGQTANTAYGVSRGVSRIPSKVVEFGAQGASKNFEKNTKLKDSTIDKLAADGDSTARDYRSRQASQKSAESRVGEVNQNLKDWAETKGLKYDPSTGLNVQASTLNAADRAQLQNLEATKFGAETNLNYQNSELSKAQTAIDNHARIAPINSKIDESKRARDSRVRYANKSRGFSDKVFGIKREDVTAEEAQSGVVGAVKSTGIVGAAVGGKGIVQNAQNWGPNITSALDNASKGKGLKPDDPRSNKEYLKSLKTEIQRQIDDPNTTNAEKNALRLELLKVNAQLKG